MDGAVLGHEKERRMKAQDKEPDDFERVTGLFADTEGLDLDDLRAIRRLLGDDVEASEERFLALLRKLEAEAGIARTKWRRGA